MRLNNFSISNLKLINLFLKNICRCKRTKRLEDYDNETMIQQKKMKNRNQTNVKH